jgi:multisubunit Na+/H+ antiporter MnhB subunit
MLPMELLHAGLSGLALGLLFHLLGLPGGGVVGAMLGAGLYQLLAPEPAPLPKSWPESSSAWASARTSSGRTSSPWPPFRPWSS